jgi:hypothetical protein
MTIYLLDWEGNTYYTITATDFVHHLRIHFDHKLLWDKHISVVTTRTNGMLKSLLKTNKAASGIESMCEMFENNGASLHLSSHNTFCTYS